MVITPQEALNDLRNRIDIEPIIGKRRAYSREYLQALKDVDALIQTAIDDIDAAQPAKSRAVRSVAHLALVGSSGEAYKPHDWSIEGDFPEAGQ